MDSIEPIGETVFLRKDGGGSTVTQRKLEPFGTLEKLKEPAPLVDSQDQTSLLEEERPTGAESMSRFVSAKVPAVWKRLYKPKAKPHQTRQLTPQLTAAGR